MSAPITPGRRTPGPRARLAGAGVLIAVITLAVAMLLAGQGQLSTAFPSTATILFLGLMALAVYGIGTGHPFPALGPANWVTTARAALVALVGALAVESPSTRVATLCVVIASVAASLDGWDGWLARRTRMTTSFGARFDMEVDALLILLLGVMVWRHDKAGSWVLLSGALRYLFVAAGWAWDWMLHPLPPSFRRKAICVVQIVGLIVACSPLIPQPASALIAGGTLALLAWSFAVDVGWLVKERRAVTAGV